MLLKPEQELLPGQEIRSKNGRNSLIMQTDGNVVLYNGDRQPLWATNTHGTVKPRNLKMQGDGNLVLHDTNGKPRWASGTYGHPGAFLQIQDDCNLVIYRAGSEGHTTAKDALWATDTYPGAPKKEQHAGPGGAAQEILDAHNRTRSEFGVSALKWSDSLAASAKQWASHLASSGQFEHSGSPHGENLAMGAGRAYAPRDLVQMWVDERRHFRAGTFPDVSNDGKWESVGHFTQVIWPGTTAVGGAIVTAGDKTVLVCHYDPAGNMMGNKVP
jgi:hypothetical protein